MRALVLLVLVGCSAEAWNNVEQMRPRANPVPPRECYDRSGCASSDEVCMIPEGKSSGSCVKVR